MGVSPFFLVYNRDPTLPIHKLIKTIESYKGDKDIGTRKEQTCIALCIAAKTLARKHADEKKSTNHITSNHKFKV